MLANVIQSWNTAVMAFSVNPRLRLMNVSHSLLSLPSLCHMGSIACRSSLILACLFCFSSSNSSRLAASLLRTSCFRPIFSGALLWLSNISRSKSDWGLKWWRELDDMDEDVEDPDTSPPSWAQRLTISLDTRWHCSRRTRYSSVQRDSSAVTADTYAAVTSTTWVAGSGSEILRKLSSRCGVYIARVSCNSKCQCALASGLLLTVTSRSL